MKPPSEQKATDRPLKIFISAGEVSGDRQAAHLAGQMFRQGGDLQLFGCGGGAMQSAGVDVRITTAQYGCIGIQESARFARPLQQALNELSQMLSSERPDMAVLVDSEHFNGHLSRFLHRERIPFVYYFPPQVWLWGRWRARGVARRSRLIIPAFSAEVDIYRRKGGRVRWCGHPLLDLVEPEEDVHGVFQSLGLEPSRPVLAIMPGSRVQELEEMAPVMFAAAHRIRERHPQLQFIVPVAAPHLQPQLERRLPRPGWKRAQESPAGMFTRA